MKRTIRAGVWETNSSSVHALSIDPSGMEPSQLPIGKDGYIRAHFGQFGREDGLYTSQEDKLSYLLTECYYINGYSTDFENCYTYKYLEEAVCAYTGAKGIKIAKRPEPELDHQSLPEYGEFKFINNEWMPEEIQNFIFNRYIRFTTGCD